MSTVSTAADAGAKAAAADAVDRNGSWSDAGPKRQSKWVNVTEPMTTENAMRLHRKETMRQYPAAAEYVAMRTIGSPSFDLDAAAQELQAAKPDAEAVKKQPQLGKMEAEADRHCFLVRYMHSILKSDMRKLHLLEFKSDTICDRILTAIAARRVGVLSNDMRDVSVYHRYFGNASAQWTEAEVLKKLGADSVMLLNAKIQTLKQHASDNAKREQQMGRQSGAVDTKEASPSRVAAAGDAAAAAGDGKLDDAAELKRAAQLLDALHNTAADLPSTSELLELNTLCMRNKQVADLFQTKVCSNALSYHKKGVATATAVNAARARAAESAAAVIAPTEQAQTQAPLIDAQKTTD